MQTDVAKGLKVPCLFMIAEVSISWRLVYAVYPRIPPIHHCGCPSYHPTNSVKALKASLAL